MTTWPCSVSFMASCRIVLRPSVPLTGPRASTVMAPSSLTVIRTVTRLGIVDPSLLDDVGVRWRCLARYSLVWVRIERVSDEAVGGGDVALDVRPARKRTAKYKG